LGGPWIHAALPWHHGRNFVDLGPRQAIAAAIILGLAWINTRGVGRAGTFQLWVTICKVVGLLLLLAAIALFGHSATEQTLLPAVNHDPSPLAYGGALLAVMATYNGWANAAIIGGEVRDAERTISRGHS
jgi:basic amino acid/polyamine antiporter, APA family